jgi:predicted transcriptional regulator
MPDNVKRQEHAAAYDRWFRQQVQIGIDQADAGDFVPAEEVEAEAAAWMARMRREMTHR